MNIFKELLNDCHDQGMLFDIINQGCKILEKYYYNNNYNKSRKPFIKEVLYVCCYNNIAKHRLIDSIKPMKRMLKKTNRGHNLDWEQIAHAVIHNNFDAITELVDALEFMSSDSDNDTSSSQDSDCDELVGLSYFNN